jgi:ribosomal protein L11 methyltransferase
MPAVAIDPGLAFGTGHHATTRYCLSQLARLHRREPRQRQPPPHRPMSALDAGTGSGLLAIAAAKLGYRPVIAFDSDPDAVRVARGNIASNRVRGLVTLATGDLADRRLRIGGPFDVVCANLSAELLEAQSRRLSRWVNPGGHLVVAGILATEFAAVTRAFEGAGLRLQSARTEQGWRSGRFAKLEAGRTRRRHSPTRSSEKKLNAPGRHAL